MSALTAHDRWLQSLVANDPAMSADDESVIEQMIAEPDCFDNWLSGRPCPSSVAGLLALILDRGLPHMDKSRRDDDLLDKYYTLIDSARQDFDAWAQTRTEGKSTSPFERWIVEDRF